MNDFEDNSYQLRISYLSNFEFLKFIFKTKFKNKKRPDLQRFQQNISLHINDIIRENNKILDPNNPKVKHKFSKLSVKIIDKSNNEKRILAIPQVKDRLIQKAIIKILTSSDKLDLKNSISYGLDKGVNEAIEDACKLRDEYKWVLKTDIQSFFDTIDRKLLKEKLRKKLRKNKLIPTLESIIDCEIDYKSLSISDREIISNKKKEKKFIKGKGLRQGMPLSPLLSNFVLRDFDKKLEKKNIKAIRYIDDILLFAKNKDSLNIYKDIVKNELLKLGLSINDIKTEIFKPNQRITDFLGFDLKPNDKYKKRTVAKISKANLNNFKNKFNKDFSDWKKFSLQELLIKMQARIDGYKSVYGPTSGKYEYRAINYMDLQNLLEKQRRRILRTVFKEVLGATSFKKIIENERKRFFLGINDLKIDKD
jgi:retron-type reverse transcriptase